jgi:hypothetical protein
MTPVREGGAGRKHRRRAEIQTSFSTKECRSSALFAPAPDRKPQRQPGVAPWAQNGRISGDDVSVWNFLKKKEENARTAMNHRASDAGKNRLHSASERCRILY